MCKMGSTVTTLGCPGDMRPPVRVSEVVDLPQGESLDQALRAMLCYVISVRLIGAQKWGQMQCLPLVSMESLLGWLGRCVTER